MDGFLSNIMAQLTSINWQGPAVFVIILLLFLSIFRKWSLVLLILLTIVLAWGAQDLIITNLESRNELITVPFLIYCVGGGTVLILFLISFFKSAV